MNEAAYHAILRRLGVDPVGTGDGLGVSTPSGPDPLEVARLLRLPLDRLDRLIEVRMPWLPVTLWFVPDDTAVELLVGEGVSRGRIWTRQELIDLLSIPGITKVGAQTLALTKLGVDDGEITRIVRLATLVTLPPQPGWLPGLGGGREPDA
jgi:hypothetical protein